MDYNNNFNPNNIGIIHGGNNDMWKVPTRIEDMDIQEIKKIQEKVKYGRYIFEPEKKLLNAYLRIIKENEKNVIPTNSIALACFKKKGKNATDPCVFYSNYYNYDLIIPLIKSSNGKYYDSKFLKQIDITNAYLPPNSRELFEKLGYEIDEYDFFFLDDVVITEDKKKQFLNEHAYTIAGDCANVSTNDCTINAEGVNNGFITIGELNSIVDYIQQHENVRFSDNYPVDRKGEANLFIRNLGKEGM